MRLYYNECPIDEKCKSVVVGYAYSSAGGSYQLDVTTAPHFFMKLEVERTGYAWKSVDVLPGEHEIDFVLNPEP